MAIQQRQPQTDSAGIIAVANFLTAQTSFELEDAYEDLLGLGVSELTQVHEKDDGFTMSVTLLVDDLFAVFFPLFIERELDLMCQLLTQLEGDDR